MSGSEKTGFAQLFAWVKASVNRERADAAEESVDPRLYGSIWVNAREDLRMTFDKRLSIKSNGLFVRVFEWDLKKLNTR